MVSESRVLRDGIGDLKACGTLPSVSGGYAPGNFEKKRRTSRGAAELKRVCASVQRRARRGWLLTMGWYCSIASSSASASRVSFSSSPSAGAEEAGAARRSARRPHAARTLPRRPRQPRASWRPANQLERGVVKLLQDVADQDVARSPRASIGIALRRRIACRRADHLRSSRARHAERVTKWKKARASA